MSLSTRDRCTHEEIHAHAHTQCTCTCINTHTHTHTHTHLHTHTQTGATTSAHSTTPVFFNTKYVLQISCQEVLADIHTDLRAARSAHRTISSTLPLIRLYCKKVTARKFILQSPTDAQTDAPTHKNTRASTEPNLGGATCRQSLEGETCLACVAPTCAAR